MQSKHSPIRKEYLTTPRRPKNFTKSVRILNIASSPCKLPQLLTFEEIFESPKSQFNKTTIYSGSIEALNIIPKSIRLQYNNEASDSLDNFQHRLAAIHDDPVFEEKIEKREENLSY